MNRLNEICQESNYGFRLHSHVENARTGRRIYSIAIFSYQNQQIFYADSASLENVLETAIDFLEAQRV